MNKFLSHLSHCLASHRSVVIGLIFYLFFIYFWYFQVTQAVVNPTGVIIKKQGPNIAGKLTPQVVLLPPVDQQPITSIDFTSADHQEDIQLRRANS